MVVSNFNNKRQTKQTNKTLSSSKKFLSWSRQLPILWLQYLFLGSDTTLSQLLIFLGLWLHLHLWVYPMQSRNTLAQSYLNQFKASHMQPNAFWPHEQQEKRQPLYISALTLWGPSLKYMFIGPSHDELTCHSPAADDHRLLPTCWYSKQPGTWSSFCLPVYVSIHTIPHTLL